MRKFLILAVALAMVPAAASVAGATYVLTDLNSTFAVDLNNNPTQWTVDNTYQLYRQGFWFRLGDVAGTGQSSLFSEPTTVQSQTANSLQLRFTHSQFTADVAWTLFGGTAGSYTSDVAESIRLRNTSGSTLHMRFFQYSDFDLNGTPGNDLLSFPNANTVDQTDPAGPVGLSETVVTPPASHHQGSNSWPSLYNLINSSSNYTLNDSNPGTAGDSEWAFEWDVDIAANGSYLISKDKHISEIPEPGSVILLGVVLLGAVGLGRRRRK
jgi:hypothetical protein